MLFSCQSQPTSPCAEGPPQGDLCNLSSGFLLLLPCAPVHSQGSHATVGAKNFPTKRGQPCLYTRSGISFLRTQPHHGPMVLPLHNAAIDLAAVGVMAGQSHIVSTENSGAFQVMMFICDLGCISLCGNTRL